MVKRKVNVLYELALRRRRFYLDNSERDVSTFKMGTRETIWDFVLQTRKQRKMGRNLRETNSALALFYGPKCMKC